MQPVIPAPVPDPDGGTLPLPLTRDVTGDAADVEPVELVDVTTLRTV
jgi:hypothetical protein